MQKDGGIYNRFLANYTTSVAARGLQGSEHRRQVRQGDRQRDQVPQGCNTATDQTRTRSSAASATTPSRGPTCPTRSFTVEALLAAGVPKDDPAIKKALNFISRCQNLPGESNDQPFAKKTSDDDKGGFVYNPPIRTTRRATSERRRRPALAKAA